MRSKVETRQNILRLFTINRDFTIRLFLQDLDRLTQAGILPGIEPFLLVLW